MNISLRMFEGADDWRWCNQQVGVNQTADTTGILAVNTDTGERYGACIMDNWTNNSVQCHFMLTRPMVLRHKLLECCFNYMFIERGVARAYGLVPADNAKAVKINTHMGFTLKSVLEEAYDVGVDYLVMEMKRENCTYIEMDKAA
jgi:hypothetical protein